MPLRPPTWISVTTPAGVFLTLTPLASSGRTSSASSAAARTRRAATRILIGELHEFLDDAVAPAALERLLRAPRQRHADTVDHRLPDAADPQILLRQVALVPDSQPRAAGQHERQVGQGVSGLALHGPPGRHRVVEQRPLAFLDALELAQEVGPFGHV